MKMTLANESLSSPVRVNVRLCGGIPRKDLAEQLSSRGAAPQYPLIDLSPSDLNSSACPALPESDDSPLIEGLAPQIQSMSRIHFGSQPLVPAFEPPAWAVAAQGESRLEPVCESLGRQSPVDLTSRSCFRVGRSPACDVQLFHGTSSRRHALLFHSSNGTCYIVDCGSAHGTFVNGVRVTSPPNGGVVIPQKVRRGAMLRFGGPGAPCFVLKSFAFKLQELADDTPVVIPNDDFPCEEEKSSVVQKNTRFNALGKSACDFVRRSSLSLAMKRSFDSVETLEAPSCYDEEPCPKRMRCSSPPPSPEEPLRLVSPDLPCASKLRRVTFCPQPTSFYPNAVTPEELSSDEDNGSF